MVASSGVCTAPRVSANVASPAALSSRSSISSCHQFSRLVPLVGDLRSDGRFHTKAGHKGKVGCSVEDRKMETAACKDRSSEVRRECGVQRRDFMKKALVGGLAIGLSGQGSSDLALAEIWPSEYNYLPVASKQPVPQPVKYRETRNATPFTVTYPDRFVEALNRKPGTEVAKDNGEETLVLIGDFKTFDTVSVLRYPIQPGTPGTVSAEEISEKLIIGGNIATEFVRKEVETPSDPSQGNKYHFEYVTEQCRGEVVEGLGGKKECFRGDSLLPTITRHHLVNVEAFKGFFYVVTASAAQTRWSDAKPDFDSVLSSFKLLEPAAPPLEA